MTAIAGFVSGNKVYIAGDSAGVGGGQTHHRKDVKVFKISAGKTGQKREMVIGYTSSFRMGQVIRFHVKLPAHPAKMDDYEYMVTQFIPAVKKQFKKHGYERKKDGEDRGGTFLAGYNGNLFLIHDSYQVAMQLDPYAACGCGRDLCMGALHALRDMDLKPEERLTLALESAIRFSSGVEGPIVIESL